MTDNPKKSAEPTPWASFLVGGMLVVVLVIGYMVTADGGAAKGESVPADIRIETQNRAPALADQ